MAAIARRRALLDALLIFALALGLRVVYLSGFAGDPFAHELMSNAAQYDEQARVVLDGGRQPVTSGFQPLYTYALSVVYAVFGPSPAAVRLVQVVLGALTAALLTLAGSALGRREGLAAGLLWSGFWPSVLYAGELLPDTLITVLVVAAFAAAWAALRGGRPWWWAASALALGLATVGKPNAALLAPWAPLAVWLQPGPHRAGRGTQLAASLLLPAAVIGAVLVAPALVEGDRSSTRAFAAKTLWDGNHADSDGINPFQAEFPETLAWDVWRDPDDTAAIAGKFLGEVGRHAREAPGSFLRLQGRKVWIYLSTHEVGNNLSVPWRRDRIAVLAAPLWLGFGGVLALALAGLVVAVPRWREFVLPLGWALTWSASIVGILVAGRYRLPGAALLCVVAGVGLVALVDTARRRETGRLALLLGCLLAGVLVSATDPLGLREYRIATVLQMEAEVLDHAGDPVAAEQHYREGIGLPRDGASLERCLGLFLVRYGRVGEGLEALRHAAARAPQQADLHGDYGATLRELGQPAEALPPLEAAVALAPGDASSHYNLGLALADLGRLGEAEAALGESIALGRDDGAVWSMRGVVRARAEDWEGAETDLRAAAARTPGDCSVAANLGLVLQRAGRLDEAAAEYERCPTDPVCRDRLSRLEIVRSTASPAPAEDQRR